MSISARRKWASSERIAVKVLEELGYKILAEHYPIIIEGVEVGEADLLVEDPNTGERYCVEVKAGKIDVSGLRQAYINAELLNVKPMVICKGFANRAAEKLADELKIKVIKLSNQFLVGSEELEVIVRSALEDIILKYIELLLSPTYKLKPEYYELVKAIITSNNIVEASRKLKLNIHEVAKMIGKLRNEGIIPKWATSFKSIKIALTLLYYKLFIDEKLSKLSGLIRSIEKMELR